MAPGRVGGDIQVLPWVGGAARGRFTVDRRSKEAVRDVGALVGADLTGRPLKLCGLRAEAIWWELHCKKGSKELKLPTPGPPAMAICGVSGTDMGICWRREPLGRFCWPARPCC